MGQMPLVWLPSVGYTQHWIESRDLFSIYNAKVGKYECIISQKIVYDKPGLVTGPDLRGMASGDRADHAVTCTLPAARSRTDLVAGEHVGEEVSPGRGGECATDVTNPSTDNKQAHFQRW